VKTKKLSRRPFTPKACLCVSLCLHMAELCW